jgi:hypothetical protein
MDLLSAKKEAIEKSKKEKRTVYIVVDGDGECSVHGAPLKGSIAAYNKGSEVALPPNAAADQENSEALLKGKKAKSSGPKSDDKTKINEKMATVKKSAPKKAEKKTKTSTEKKSATGFDKANKATWGKKVDVSIKKMREGLKKGFIFRDPQGVKQTEEYMKGRANQDFVRKGMYQSGPF